MTKEQLEKIRKRKYAEDRIVYTVFDNDEEATALHIVYDNELLVAYMMLERVYETKEEAEWHYKTHAERTQRFEPPMWKDIDEGYLFRFLVGDDFYEFVASKHSENKCSVFLKNFCTNKLIIAESDGTKEDYKKACEIVKGLIGSPVSNNAKEEK